MIKRDFKKELRTYYSATAKKVEILDIPSMNFLVVEGSDATPESPDFQAAIEALFGISYHIKFAIKKSGIADYGVMPLEGKWWADDMDDFVHGNKEKWHWQLMIMQPDLVDNDLFEANRNTFQKKKSNHLAEQVQFLNIEEGHCAQVMHVGPFSEEGPTVERLHQAIHDAGGSFDGQTERHHEIYLNDFRRIAPDRMKTILRQPFHQPEFYFLED